MRQMLIRSTRHFLASRSGLGNGLFRYPNRQLSNVSLSYEQGIPRHSSSGYSASTLGQLLESATRRTPERTAIIVPHQETVKTYRQFNDEVNQLAKGLRAIGCRRGDPVGLWAVNSYEWLLVQFATVKLGCILVTINPGYKESELRGCINLVGLKTLLTNQQFRSSNYTQILENVSPGLLGNAKGCRVHSKEMPTLENLIVLNEPEEIAPTNVMRFSELLALGQSEAQTLSQLLPPGEQTQMDDVINVQFTSGTTGSPKGAMLTHFNIVQNVRFLTPRLYEDYESHDGEDAIVALPNPLYHCFGCVVGSASSFHVNGTLVLPGPVPSARTTLHAVEKYKCNFVYGTPTMWSDLLLQYSQAKEKYNMSSLKRGVMSGAPCPPVLLGKLRETFPSLKNVLIPYGTTELSPVVTLTSIRDSERQQTETVGRPLEYVEMKVIDPRNGQIVPRGTRGEVCFKSHGTFPGYFRQPEKTAEVIDANFWYHTGDIGYIDEEGYLTISGRIKEMIIRGGENIYPKEIEDYLLQHEAVEDAHIVGAPDERLGEEMVAYIKLKSSVATISTQEMKDFLKGKISHFKVPRYIRFVDDYPRTITGKVQKVKLKEMAAKENWSLD